MSNKYNAFFKSYADTEDELNFKMAHESIGEKVPVISTGSLNLDEALSCGGLPCGRLIQLYGAPGSGKSLMSMIAILEAQKLDPEADQMFIDAEGTFDPIWAKSLGVDVSRILWIENELAANGRKCFEMLLGTPKADARTHELVGKKEEGFLDKVIKKEYNVNLIVLDSLGSIQAPGEDTSAVGKMNMSLMARFLSTTLKKLALEVKKANLPFIIINHKRDNMDPYGSSDHTFAGGNTYGHYLSANIYFEAIQRKDAQILDDKEQKIGHTMRAKIEKSKFGPWPRQCEFKIEFNKGIVERQYEVLDICLKYDIITKPSTVAHEYGDRKWVGYDKCASGIAEDPALMEELIGKIQSYRENKLDNMRKEQAEQLKPTVKESKKKSKKDDVV